MFIFPCVFRVNVVPLQKLIRYQPYVYGHLKLSECCLNVRLHGVYNDVMSLLMQ